MRTVKTVTIVILIFVCSGFATVAFKAGDALAAAQAQLTAAQAQHQADAAALDKLDGQLSDVRRQLAEFQAEVQAEAQARAEATVQSMNLPTDAPASADLSATPEASPAQQPAAPVQPAQAAEVISLLLKLLTR